MGLWSAWGIPVSTTEGCCYRQLRPMTGLWSRAQVLATSGVVWVRRGLLLSRLGSGTRSRVHGMGEVIRLEDRRARRRAETVGDAVRAEFLFGLASPFKYLAAERVERAFDEVTW